MAVVAGLLIGAGTFACEWWIAPTPVYPAPSLGMALLGAAFAWLMTFMALLAAYAIGHALDEQFPGKRPGTWKDHSPPQ